MSGIDKVIFFYKLLNVSAVTSIIDGKVWRYNRPINSKKTDVVVSMPEYIGGSFNKYSIEINVHSPNELIVVNGIQDSTHPSVAKLQAVTDAILLLIDGYDIKVSGKVVRDNDGHWYSQIILDDADINPDLGIDASMIELKSVADGYGGFTYTSTEVWSGKISMVDIAKGDQLYTQSDSFSFNQRNDFIVPFIPQKNYIIRTSESDYIIRGITPETKGYWRVHAYRQDRVRS